jgi:hypothetical protein
MEVGFKNFVTIRNSYPQQGLSNYITVRPIKSGATVPLSSCLLVWKHLLILEILKEAASEFPTLAAPQRELETSIQLLKKPTANYLPVILKSNTETRLTFFEFFHHHLRLTEQFTESQAASMNAATSILKRVSERIFKIF